MVAEFPKGRMGVCSTTLLRERRSRTPFFVVIFHHNHDLEIYLGALFSYIFIFYFIF